MILCNCAAMAPGPVAPDFRLIDQNGKSFELSQTRGQSVALYFGFTHCKDICPQTLVLLSKARSRARLSPAQLRIVMISIDPKHDTPVALRSFFARTGVQATGLTGSPTALRPVYHAYGIAVLPEKGDIVHTDTVFLIDRHGIERAAVDPNLPLNAVANALRAVVE